MAWSMDIRRDGGVEEVHLAADAPEREAVTVYLCRRSRVALVVEAPRRAEAAARLNAALRQMAVQKVGARHTR